jgi:hypothetical protein
MRGLAAQDIENLLAANITIPAFLPDERVVFSNYTSRYAMGAFARIPAIIGTTQHEFNAIVPDVPGFPFNQTQVDALTNTSFLCTATQTSQLRQAHGLATYRFRYDGNFSNISPPEFSGAYHASELPLIFGTADEFHGKSTPYEDSVSVRMQRLWLTFATNLETGLWHAGWNLYNSEFAQEPLEPPRGLRTVRKLVTPPPNYDVNSSLVAQKSHQPAIFAQRPRATMTRRWLQWLLRKLSKLLEDSDEPVKVIAAEQLDRVCQIYSVPFTSRIIRITTSNYVNNSRS